MLTTTDQTITSGSVTQKLLGGLKTATAARNAAGTIGVQNRHATQDLFVKSGTADTSADAILVKAGELLVLNSPNNAANGLDADMVYVFSTLATHPYSVFRIQG